MSEDRAPLQRGTSGKLEKEVRKLVNEVNPDAQARHNEIATLRTEVERLQADVLHYQDKYNQLRSQTSRLRREEISAADLREFQKLQAASRNTVPVNQVYRLAAFAVLIAGWFVCFHDKSSRRSSPTQPAALLGKLSSACLSMGWSAALWKASTQAPAAQASLTFPALMAVTGQLASTGYCAYIGALPIDSKSAGVLAALGVSAASLLCTGVAGRKKASDEEEEENKETPATYTRAKDE